MEAERITRKERERMGAERKIKDGENPPLSSTGKYFVYRPRLFSLADEYPRWMKVEFIVNRGEVKWRGWIESSREKMVSRVKEEAGEDLPSDRGETSRYSLSSTDVFH